MSSGTYIILNTKEPMITKCTRCHRLSTDGLPCSLCMAEDTIRSAYEKDLQQRTDALLETVANQPGINDIVTINPGRRKEDKEGIDATLAERGERYGSFEHHAEIAQELQDVIRSKTGWFNLASDQKQALTVICDKIARMLNGDPSYRDNWHDIVGYAKLVDDRMKRDEEKKAKP